MKLKKWLLTTLSVGCIGAMALGFAACGDKDGDDNEGGGNTPALADVNYTLVLTDQDGNAVVGAELKLLQGETQIALGTTDSEGKIEGVAKEGEYVVRYGTLPEGYLADDYTVEVTVSVEDAIVELSAINNIPNGTAGRPFTFIGDALGLMTISVPANATHYYLIPRPMGRNLIVGGENFEIVYDGDSYLPESGETEIVFNSEADDVYATELIAVVNKAATENEIALLLPVPPGSTPEAAIEAILDGEMTATVKGESTVYYTWTATASGTLTGETSSPNGGVYFYNENTYAATSWGASVSIVVNEGDIILIQIGVSGTVDSTEVNEITFALTIE